MDIVPTELRHLRACLLCSLVKDVTVLSLSTVPLGTRNVERIISPLKVVHELLYKTAQTIDQFEIDGCENCDRFLQMKGNRDMVLDCTSTSFDGLIALMIPDESWVGKWQRINRNQRGCYAISVTGRLPPGIVRELKTNGVTYRSRDTALKT